MKIFAIETSMDETAVAVVEQTDKGVVRVLGEAIASSSEMHTKTGGVVPEVAAREQVVAMIPVVREALQRSKVESRRSNQEQLMSEGVEIVELNRWARKNIDMVAVTQGPGMIGSLLVGVETAKTLALTWEKPLVPINHLWGHLYANWIGGDKPPELPALGLIVSGGHTDIVLMHKHNNLEVVGGTGDDAAGECLDKCARVLGLPYPGGPEISRLADKFEAKKTKIKIGLPRPMKDSGDLMMSFSGLKAAFVREVQALGDGVSEEDKERLAYELQEAVVEVLVEKSLQAMDKYKPKSFLLCGGVAANSLLRRELELKIQNSQFKVQLFVPEVRYCTDNAAMIGAAAVFNHSPADISTVSADPALDLV